MSVADKAAAVELRLVDTNVVSFLMEGRPPADEYSLLLRGFQPVVSFMSLGELYEGAYRANWGDRRFRRMLRFMEGYPVIDSSRTICQRWGEIRTVRRRQPIAPDDAWIAATALVHDCPLVTHNPVDFAGIRGLRIVSAVPGQ